MMAFLRGDADVLVCTSIIESGIDIPAANTLVVEHADHFGLAQLYQIRGRVGRSRERAYAYLLYDAAAVADAAGGAAARRALGLHRAGLRLPGRDARPRAARRRQPARRRAVGARRRARLRALHADARRGARGGAAPRRATAGEREWEPVRVDVDVDAYVPADYVGYEQAKIDVHRRIAGAREVADIEELREELDRPLRRRRRSRSSTCSPCSARASSSAPPGARSVSFRGGRLVVAPVELDSERRCASCARACPRRSTTRGARRSRCASPTPATERFPGDPRRRRRGARRRRRARLSGCRAGAGRRGDSLASCPRAPQASNRHGVLRRDRHRRHSSARAAAACPATPSCRSATRRSPARRSTTGWWSPTTPASRRPARKAPPLPLPPDYTACVSGRRRRPATRRRASRRPRSRPTRRPARRTTRRS